jgi:hypothetical protein
MNWRPLFHLHQSFARPKTVEAGEVKLDDHSSKYVDEIWLPRATADQITICSFKRPSSEQTLR